MKREEAYELLSKNMTKENLLKHSLTVEAVMRHFAEINKEDVEYWGVVGLLHDIDYEKYPDQHCKKCREILSKEKLDDDFIKSIETHGHGMVDGMPEPEKFMEKVMITIDQLSGFITACALVIPSKKLEDVKLSSMKKKWKKKDFAASTQRERIEHWTGELGYDLEYMMEQTLEGMKKISDDLGL